MSNPIKHLIQIVESNQYEIPESDIDITAEHIVKVPGGYELKSKKTGRNLGKYPTRAGAEKRERQVQYFKHANEDTAISMIDDDISDLQNFVRAAYKAELGFNPDWSQEEWHDREFLMHWLERLTTYQSDDDDDTDVSVSELHETASDLTPDELRSWGDRPVTFKSSGFEHKVRSYTNHGDRLYLNIDSDDGRKIEREYFYSQLQGEVKQSSKGQRLSISLKPLSEAEETHQEKRDRIKKLTPAITRKQSGDKDWKLKPEEVSSRIHDTDYQNRTAHDINQGVAEGSDYTPPKLGTVKANLMNTQKPTVQVKVFKHNTLRGDSYWVTKEVKTFKTMDQAQAYVDRINEQGVAEGSHNNIMSAWNSGMADDEIVKQFGQSAYDSLKRKYGSKSIPVPDLYGYIPKEPTDPVIRRHRGLDGPGKQLKSQIAQINKLGLAEGYDEFDDEEESNLHSGSYVRDREDPSGEVFVMRGDASERRVQILDRNGSGWNISPSRLIAVDANDPAIARYFGKQGVAEGTPINGVSNNDVYGDLVYAVDSPNGKAGTKVGEFRGYDHFVLDWAFEKALKARGQYDNNEVQGWIQTSIPTQIKNGRMKIIPSTAPGVARKDPSQNFGQQGVAEGWDKLTPQQQAHEYNLDAAQREMDRRHAQGEDMTGAKIDKKTYKIVKPKQQGVAEAKNLKKRVKIVKGPDAGKTGWIREIKHGAFKGAPKSYYIDLDDGGQANNLPATALRLAKDQGVAEGKEDLHAQLQAINQKLKLMKGGPVGEPNSVAFVEKRKALLKQKEQILSQLKQGVAEEASPMIKPPNNRFDNKQEAFKYAKEHGGSVFKSQYIDPNTGVKNISFVVKKKDS